MAYQWIQEKGHGFCYHCIVSGDGKSFDFLACLWSSQIKKLSYYGDLVFIDSAFNVTSDGYKGLCLVIVDQHFKSLVGAFAFAKCEAAEVCDTFLSFTREHIPSQEASTLPDI